MFEVPELEQALAQAGFEGYGPQVYGGLLSSRRGRENDLRATTDGF